MKYLIIFLLFFQYSLFPANEKVLVLYLDDLPEVQGEIVGVDPSQILVDLASSMLKGTFVKVSPTELVKGEYDLITSSSLRLLHEDMEFVLEKMGHLLAPEGELLFKIPSHVPRALESAFRFVALKAKWKDQIVLSKMRTRFYQKGTVTPKEITFDSEEAFSAFLERWVFLMHPLPTEIRAEFQKELVERYLEVFPKDKEGLIHFLYEEVTICNENLSLGNKGRLGEKREQTKESKAQ